MRSLKLYLALLCSIVLFSLNSSFGEYNRSKKSSGGNKFEKGKYYYTDPSLCEFAARFINENEITLTGVKFLAGGNDTISTIKIRVYGNEGGDNVPNYRRPLIEPVVVEKKKSGVEEFEVKFPKPIVIKQSGYFISFETISGDAKLASTKNEIKCFCTSKVSGEYYSQAIRKKSGEWFVGKYQFVALPIFTESKIETGKYFKLIDLGESFDARANVATIFDINGDAKPDLLIDGRIAINQGEFSFKVDSIHYKITDSVAYQSVLDIDKDGDLDIVIFGNRDSITKKLAVILYKNIGNSFKRIPLEIDNVYNPFSITSGFINQDYYLDLIICQSKDTLLTTNMASLVLLNDKNLSFYSVKGTYSGEELPAAQAAAIGDLNNDGIYEIYFATSEGSIGAYSMSHNGNLEKFNDPRIGSILENQINTSDFALSDISIASGINSQKKEVMLVSSVKKISSDLLSSTSLIRLEENRNPFLSHVSNFSLQSFQTGTCPIDINNDGNLDYISLTGDTCREPDLYINNGDGGYKSVSFSAGFNRFNMGKDAIAADLDLDGKTDIVTIANGRLALFKNDYTKLEKENNYISFTGSNSKTISKLTLIVNDTVYDYSSKSLNGKSLESAESVIKIGLGEKDLAQEAIIETINGDVYVKNNLKPNRLYSPEDFTKNENENNPILSAWPVPFASSLFINVENFSTSDYSIIIKNSSGSVIASGNSIIKTGTNTFRWDGVNDMGQQASSGIYFIEFRSGSLVRYIKTSKVQ